MTLEDSFTKNQQSVSLTDEHGEEKQKEENRVAQNLEVVFGGVHRMVVDGSDVSLVKRKTKLKPRRQISED